MKDVNLSMIEKAKNGDSDAFECIFKQYLPIVLKQRNKYFLRDYELDDWLQEGRIVCYKALQKYDPEINVTFGLFFKISFERWVISALRYQQAKKRQPPDRLDSLDQKLEEKEKLNEPYEFESMKDIRLEYVFAKEDLVNASKKLSNFEVKIYQYVLEGNELTKIAEELHVGEKQVMYGYTRLKRKLKDQLDI